jgi:two-component system heavy metal sensor histidine kinase CusS
MRRLTIRRKLTLWYGAVLALVLAAFSVAVYFTMRHQLLQRIDLGLSEELADVLSEVRRARDDAGLKEWLERRFAQHAGFDFQITRANGQRFFANERLGTASFPIAEGVAASPAFRDVALDSGGRWRVVSVQVQGPTDVLTVQVARSLEPFDHESRELLLTFLLLGPLTLLVAVGGGYFLARRALAPVEQITSTANQITAERLHQRIEVPNADDELGGLADTLNRMIGRLEKSFAEMQRFTADAAHELRTPLAVIRNEAEVALRAQRTPEEYSRALENLLEEANRLGNVADQLLFLCRQDAGLLAPAREEVDFQQLLQEVVGNMQLVAQEKAVNLVLEDPPPCRLVSDSRQLRRVLYNLLDNAIKYTPASGQVRVNSNIDTNRLVVNVTDSGIGVAPEHVPHIFDRFYRADPARERDGSGAGLGLAICRSIILALGGGIEMQSMVGKGSKVCFHLPRCNERSS